MFEKLQGFRTYIVFGLVLAGELASKLFGWEVSLSSVEGPLAEWIVPIVSLVGLIIRSISKGPAGFKKQG